MTTRPQVLGPTAHEPIVGKPRDADAERDEHPIQVDVSRFGGDHMSLHEPLVDLTALGRRRPGCEHDGAGLDDAARVE